MEAILSAARSGVSSVEGTLFVTTFPCHNCAKHIVGAGLERVVYIEPYPKSQAAELYPDSIAFEPSVHETARVRFEPFVGVAPRRFADLFSLAQGGGRRLRRKTEGRKKEWQGRTARPRLPLEHRSYLEREEKVAEQLQDLMGAMGDDA